MSCLLVGCATGSGLLKRDAVNGFEFAREYRSRRALSIREFYFD
jgi:hypothetical protein